MSEKQAKMQKRMMKKTMAEEAGKYKFEGMKDVFRAYAEMSLLQRLKLCYQILFKLKRKEHGDKKISKESSKKSTKGFRFR